MENERSTDKLARYIIRLGGLAIIVALCLYFKSVLIYIIAAVVISLLGQPFMRLMRKIKIKGKSAPDWLLAVLAIVIIIVLLLLIISQIIPLVSSIVRDASAINEKSYFGDNPLDSVNQWIIGLFPGLDSNFNVATVAMEKLRELVDFGKVGGIVGSVASLVTSLFVAVFAIVFISFFFLKEEGLFGRIVCAFVPDKHELTMNKTMNEIKELLSRYFVGLLLEMLGVAVLAHRPHRSQLCFGYCLHCRLAQYHSLCRPHLRLRYWHHFRHYHKIRHWRRLGCQHLGVHPHHLRHHVYGTDDRQLHLPAPDLLDEHQGASLGNLHRDTHGKLYRRRNRDAGGHSRIHHCTRYRHPVLL